MVDVAEAHADDASAIAQLHLHTATTAYRDIVPAHTQPPSLADLEREWQGAILDPNTAVRVARGAAGVVGVVLVRADPDGVGTAWLSRLYVRPESWGAGIGGRLHDAALGNARERSFCTISLWVLEQNMRARQFYEKRGWALVEGELLDWPKLAVREVRYELDLSP